MSIQTIVDNSLRIAGIPMTGVSFGDLADRSTWAVQFTPAATPAQRTQAAAILAAVAVDTTAQTAQDQKEAQLSVDALPRLEKAILLTLVDQLNVIRAALPSPLPTITVSQAIAAVRTKAGAL